MEPPTIHSVAVSDGPEGSLEVRGVLAPPPLPGAPVEFLAATPPDRRSSFAGSGLPFPNAAAAFYATPNRGVTRAGAAGDVTIRLAARPGSYYAGLGTSLVPPTLHIAWHVGETRKHAAVQLGAPVPHRSLSYARARGGPAFYAPKPPEDVRTQEAILRSSAYGAGVLPGQLTTGAASADGFWGARPAR